MKPNDTNLDQPQTDSVPKDMPQRATRMDAGRGQSPDRATGRDLMRSSQKLEVRPMLVVGVGGTGCRAVQHIKERVRKLLGGQDAPFIRYIVFDTTIADDGVSRFEEGEFVNIGHLDFSSIVQNIKNYEHLEYWFPKDRLKPMQVGLGAMGIRHIGRLCYFQWRESAEVRDRLLKRLTELKSPGLKDRVRQLSGGSDLFVDQSSGVDIHVVGSGSGGTGSGLFLDIAYDVRMLAKEIAGSVRVIGHLLLPDAFEGVIPDPVLPQAENNAHALLSEIDHFMHNGGWKVRYKGGVVETNEPPFDLIYLLGRNGSEGGVRSREEIVSMIGAVVAGLATTAVGKHVMDSAVNLIPPILSRTDEIANRPCPYASYGVSIGVVDVEEAKRVGRAVVAQRLLDGVLEGTGDLDHDAALDAHFTEHRVEFAELERWLVDVPSFSPQGAGPREAEMFRKGQHARAIRDLASEQVQRTEEIVVQRLKAAFTDGLFTKLRRLFTLPAGSGDERQMAPLPDLVRFVRGVLVRLEVLAQSCERRIESLALEAVGASRGIQELGSKVPVPNNWAQSYVAMVEREDNKTVRSPFYARLRELVMDERTRIQTVLDDLNTMIDVVRSVRRSVVDVGQSVDELETPYFRMLSTDQILRSTIDNLGAVETQFREGLVRFVDRRENARLDSRQLGLDLDRAAARAIDELLESYQVGSELNVHALARNADPAYLRDRAKSLVTLAQPSFRCSEQYPKEKLVTVGYASGDPRSEFSNYLRNIDGRSQVIPDILPDVTMFRFVYGAPLWAIQGVKKWETSAVELQIAERATHNFLDEAWADLIGPLMPVDPELEEDLWLFTMYSCSGKITKEGFTYHMYHTRLDGIRDRASMFKEFQRLLREGKLPRRRANREVEDYLINGRDDRGVLALLREYMDKLTKRLAREALTGTQRQDVKVMREEIEVLKHFIARKESDIDLDGDDGSSSQAAPSAYSQDIWLFTILQCNGRIERDASGASIEGHRLEAGSGRAAMLRSFRELLNDGILSRDTLSRDLRDYLISGEDEQSGLGQLQTWTQEVALEAERQTNDEDRALIEEELTALRSYLTVRGVGGV